MRRLGVCVICVALGDEETKHIHGHSLCDKHYQQRVRRAQNQAEEAALDSVDKHLHRTREGKAHMEVSRTFQRFLHFLNSESVGIVIDREDIHDLRLHIAPFQVCSERVAVPNALPLELQFNAPFSGDSRPEETEVVVTSKEDDATKAYRKARAKELTETAIQRQRRKTTIAFDLIEAGFHALEEKYRDSADDFALLASVVTFLRALAGSEA